MAANNLDRARELVAEAIADSQATGEAALLYGHAILAAFRVLSIVEPDALSAELSKLEAGQAREVRRRLYEIERQSQASASEVESGGADRPVEIDLAALAASAPEPPAFVLPDMLPEGEVTMLAADGGTGKSLLALFMAVCIVLGRAFYGVPTERRGVDYLSFEDSEGVIHWRLHRICSALGVELSDVIAAGLRVFDGTQCASPWYSRGQYGETGPTIAFHDIAERVGGEDRVVMVDGSADVFAGNENARAEVKAFVRLLRRLIGSRGALLLLAHVDKSGVRAGSEALGFSGSTGWNNSVRCRWYMFREADDDGGESGDVVLEVRKSNLGRAGARMVLSFDEATGVFRRVDAPTLIERAFQGSDEADAIARTIRQAWADGDPIPASTSGVRTAHAVCEARGDLPPSLRGRRGRSKFYRALERLRAAGAVHTESIRRANRHVVEVLRARE